MSILSYKRLMNEYLELALDASAREVMGEQVNSIQRGAKTGRVYGGHRASAPGEPPASDTGRLASSIAVQPNKMEKVRDIGVASGALGTTNYAVSLEFGTQRMEARPFLTPSLIKVLPKHIKRINAAMRKAAKDASPI